MLNIKQRSKEWHEFRKNHIGSSDAPIIMGVSPWKNLLDLYNEKVNCLENLDNSNFAMRRGVELEPFALSKFEEEMGFLMTPRVLTSNLTSWRSASLDGYEIEGKCAVEIKCPGKEDHNLALKGIVPEKYVPQLQHIMLVTELNTIFYMSYRSDEDYIIFEVKRDNDYIQKLIECENQFWDRIQRRDPPPSTNKNIKEIKDPYWGFYVDQWKILQSDKRKLEKKEIEIRNAFIELANNHSAYGFGLTLTKVKKKGLVDYTKISQLEGLDLEQYRKSDTESWRITVRDENE